LPLSLRSDLHRNQRVYDCNEAKIFHSEINENHCEPIRTNQNQNEPIAVGSLSGTSDVTVGFLSIGNEIELQKMMFRYRNAFPGRWKINSSFILKSTGFYRKNAEKHWFRRGALAMNRRTNREPRYRNEGKLFRFDFQSVHYCSLLCQQTPTNTFLYQ
jgi:hypothetical protein